MSLHVPERFRLTKTGNPYYDTDPSYGNNGVFEIPYQNRVFRIIASDGMGWEHVSVSLPNRCPNWPEMCFVKKLFWDEEDCVIQFHPSKKDYVNNHDTCLHLWRPIDVEFPKPPTICVGVK